MIINISPEDKKKYRKQMARKKIVPRKSRTSTLSDKTKIEAFKKFAKGTSEELREMDIQVDEHVKLNDSYMRTGWYEPKKK